MSGIFRNFTGKKETALTSRASRRLRHLLFEPLEERQMLAITPADFNAIKAAYPDLQLTAMSDYNVMEITAAELSDAKLREKIAEAGTTPQNDLIVLRTTATQNTITLNGSELAININAANFGSITIVSLGEEKLTIDANQKSRVFNIASTSTVALAGLTITGGKDTGNGGGIYHTSRRYVDGDEQHDFRQLLLLRLRRRDL